MWPDIPNRWHVEAYNGATQTQTFRNIENGAKALTIARDWFRRLPGHRIYVQTPAGRWWLTCDNGWSARGF